jgi:hypothetical protein
LGGVFINGCFKCRLRVFVDIFLIIQDFWNLTKTVDDFGELDKVYLLCLLHLVETAASDVTTIDLEVIRRSLKME